ncbi:MAG: hypothetical protein J6W03_07210 [Bacteroidaceae bacterium]|nr:hypothetical protein [Bacteroidaceae bacterium]
MKLYQTSGGMRFLLLILAATLGILQVAAQDNFGYTEPIDYSKARIVDIGVVVSDMMVYSRTNLETMVTDSVLYESEPEVIWRSENVDIYDSTQVDRAMQPRRKARRNVLEDNGQWQWGNLMDTFFMNFYYYVFRFVYPSVDADGNEIMLSGIAACPTPKGASKVNNIIIGTHITITADGQRPSAQTNNFARDDWGMLMTLAAGPKFILNDLGGSLLITAQVATGAIAVALIMTGWGAFIGAPLLAVNFITNNLVIDQIKKAWGNHDYNNNLVILADYEGYGLTKDRAHPYLYQELTARQCIDATRHGKYLYEHDADLLYLRHDIRSEFRTISVGYSQGGSVAMACHRFVEQNDLVNELHFVGSACGDGPYDPISTLMFYCEKDLEGKGMKMPVVLPLIVKGMLDTNPYMKEHKAEEYFRPEFLETGIMDWIASKNYSTDDIDKKWKKYAKDNPGKLDYSSAKMRDIMNQECYDYFINIYNNNKNTFTSAAGVPMPEHRGVMEDLHLALSSNDMTSGWNPSHPLLLFHSKGDNVVPYVNATRAKNALGSKVNLENAPNGLDHIDSGIDFFRGDDDKLDVGLKRVLSTRLFDYVTELCIKKW